MKKQRKRKGKPSPAQRLKRQEAKAARKRKQRNRKPYTPPVEKTRMERAFEGIVGRSRGGE